MNTALKLAVVASGVPQHVIARRSGLGETVLSRIVQGRRDARHEERRSIAKALGRPVAELFDVGQTQKRAR